MSGSIVRITLSLIGPGVLNVFAFSFVAAWLYDRSRKYLLLLAIACGLFALGAISQILHWPPGVGPNAMVSGGFYTLAVLAAAEGVLLRSRRCLGPIADFAIFATISGLLWYFFYVDRNLVARIYVQNFGYGLVLVIAAIRLSRLRKGRLVDRILFWTLLAFGLHFMPRTVLTVGFSAPTGELAFANSVFWQTLQLSLAVLGSGLAMAILAAAVTDMIDDLRRERDVDPLTGLFNRRGFEERISPLLQSNPRSASLILCDIDHFKSINDTSGHHVGDVILQEIGSILRGSARRGDVVGRLGGEEFAVLLPGASLSDAYECAERLRLAVARLSFVALTDRKGATASFGAATLEEADTWEALYKLADARLYQAKRTGRNRTVAVDEKTAFAG